MFVFKSTYNALKDLYTDMVERGKRQFAEQQSDIKSLQEDYLALQNLYNDALEGWMEESEVLYQGVEKIAEIIGSVSEHPNGTTKKIIRELQELLDRYEAFSNGETPNTEAEAAE